MSAADERRLMLLIGVLLIAILIGPFAGSSLVAALYALVTGG